MGEYEGGQRNPLSRAVANNGTKGRQLKGVADNRSNTLFQTQIIQRAPTKESWNNGELFRVQKADLDTGTSASNGAREHVNDASTPKPTSILFDYATGSNAAVGVKSVKNDLDAYTVANPLAKHPYKSGSYWDAGHKLASQNGGYGDKNDWVFPQNPAYNQGNSMNMAEKVSGAYDEWRGHEQQFHNGVERDGYGCWWIRLL